MPLPKSSVPPIAHPIGSVSLEKSGYYSTIFILILRRLSLKYFKSLAWHSKVRDEAGIRGRAVWLQSLLPYPERLRNNYFSGCFYFLFSQANSELLSYLGNIFNGTTYDCDPGRTS